VIFDDSVFPFSKLHPNAGAHLRSKISLLPSLLFDCPSFGGITVDTNHVPKSPFGSIELLKNQLLKSNGPSNGTVFALVFRN
jgi:hypothetical protein